MEQKKNKSTAERRMDFELASLYALAEILHTQIFHVVEDLMPEDGYQLRNQGKRAYSQIKIGARGFHRYTGMESELVNEAIGNSADSFLQFIRLLLDRTGNASSLADIYQTILSALPTNHKMITCKDATVFRELEKWVAAPDKTWPKMVLSEHHRALEFEVVCIGLISLMLSVQQQSTERAAAANGRKMKRDLQQSFNKISAWGFNLYLAVSDEMKMRYGCNLVVPGYCYGYQCILQCFRAMADRTREGGEVWKVYNLLKASTRSAWDINLGKDERRAFGDMIC